MITIMFVNGEVYKVFANFDVAQDFATKYFDTPPYFGQSLDGNLDYKGFKENQHVYVTIRKYQIV